MKITLKQGMDLLIQVGYSPSEINQMRVDRFIKIVEFIVNAKLEYIELTSIK